ncbi:MAG: GGDEF domain-containing protein [Nocardioides sp.]|uniref:GGDEF domain-containing protein n=1 Tax=Nocardioides sp. TaxID=35761 RepID=UPI0039E31987
MDVVTLQLTFAGVALCLLVLFYLTTYRITHAPFCGWWCASLVFFLAAEVAWVVASLGPRAVANPIGSVLAVCGAATVWLAARSLERPRPPWALLALAPGLTALAAILGHPGRHEWAGGLVYLTVMTLHLGLATWETWRARSARKAAHATSAAVATSLAVSSTLVTAFYLARTVVFGVAGPDYPIFTGILGTGPTTLFTTSMLVAVSHSMGALSQEQVVEDLRRRAALDDLTGLLNRATFWELAERELVGVGSGAVIVADLDSFKQVNDRFGHTAGDLVLQAFADAVRGSIRSTDLAARFGGEEFVILLPGASTAAAGVVARTISRSLQDTPLLPAGDDVTVSYGIAAVPSRIALATAIDRADAALYRAKEAGRDRIVTHEDSPARRSAPESP